MDTVKYENEAGGLLLLTETLPYVLTSVDGLYPATEYERVTVKVSGQQGETPVSGSFSPRKLKLRFAAVAETREQLRVLCENAAAVLTPTLSGKLTADTPLGARSLRVYPDATPALALKAVGCAEITVSLTAYEPLFTEPSEQRLEMAAYLGAFQFPIALSDGFTFGTRTPARIQHVRNPGQAECGLRAVLIAEGSVRDPYLLHVDSGDRLTLRRDLLGGERLEILSLPSKKRFELVMDGERINAMGLLAPDSAFPLLAVGDNLLCCGAAEHEQNLRVIVYYQPVFAL